MCLHFLQVFVRFFHFSVWHVQRFILNKLNDQFENIVLICIISIHMHIMLYRWPFVDGMNENKHSTCNSMFRVLRFSRSFFISYGRKQNTDKDATADVLAIEWIHSNETKCVVRTSTAIFFCCKESFITSVRCYLKRIFHYCCRIILIYSVKIEKRSFPLAISAATDVIWYIEIHVYITTIAVVIHRRTWSCWKRHVFQSVE